MPDTRRNAVLLAFAVAVCLIISWFLRHALLILYVSAVFAVVFKPAVDWVHNRTLLGWRPGRGAALLLLIALVLLFLGALLAIAVPSMLDNAVGLSTMLEDKLQSVPILHRFDLGDLRSRITSGLGAVLPEMTQATTDVLTGLLLIAYLILDGNALLGRILRVAPDDQRNRLTQTLHRAADRMRHWLTGQAILMAILGAASAVTFGFMGLPYFYLLAVFAGVANIVPLLGPLATVIAASAVAATQSLWKVVGVLIFYLVYQQVENAFLTPKIMKAQVQISSAMVVIALLLGGELAGIPGVLVAVPSAVLLEELANEYLVSNHQ